MTTAARPSLPPPRRPPRSGRRSCVLCYGRALLSGALFVACSGDTRPGPAVEARDSAGVRVVEAHRPVWGDSSRWRIDPEPMVDLAATGSGPEHLFYGADGVVRFSDGSLAVADGGSHEIRFFSPEGRFRAKMGREGEGPGEFTGIRGVVRTPADTLIVLDYAARVTVVGPDGTVARVFRLPHYVVEVHPLGADEIVVVAGVPTMSGYEGAGGLVRQPQVLWRYGADGARRDSIGEIAGWEGYVAVEDGRVVASIVPLFAKSSHVVVHGNTIVRGDADRMQIEETSSSGALLRIFRIADYPLDLDVATAAAERRARLGPNPRPRMAQLPNPDRRPAYSQVLVDAEAAIWLRPFLGRSERGGPETWQVLDSAGTWLGGVDVMEGLRVSSVGRDWVAGVWTDSLGVEHPRMHRLRRTP